ncbi:MAG: hypothetical protein ACLU92_02075 [Coprococcus comes]
MGSNSWQESLRFNIEKRGQSANKIRRYIRLTNLVPELLEFVDEGRIKMRPAVELSYLDEDCQRDVVDEIDLNDATPSHDQTIRMRKLFNEGNLTTEAIHAVMSEEKPNQKEKIVLRGDRVRQLIPKTFPSVRRRILSAKHWSITTSFCVIVQNVTADSLITVPLSHTLTP